MKYKIHRSEKKTTQAGKPFIRAALKDERGLLTENVLIWADFPNFEVLAPGRETSGIVETNARGFKSLKPSLVKSSMIREHRTPSTVNESQYYGATTSVSNKIEHHDILKQAQQRKHDAIAYFNATNSAIALVSGMKNKLMSEAHRPHIKQEIEYWRDWFLDEWKRYDSHPNVEQDGEEFVVIQA